MGNRRKASNNEIFTRELVTKISKLLNIPEDVVEAVLTATSLYIIKDASNQVEESDNIFLKIPKIVDIEISRITPRKSIRVENAYIEPDFRSKLRNSMFDDYDYLFEFSRNGLQKLIVDKFMNTLLEIEEGDE